MEKRSLRNYTVTYSHEGYIREVHCKSNSAQSAVCYVNSFIGEHDKIMLVERISSNGTVIKCTNWK